MARRLRILLVEDHETVRQGLKLLIDREPDLEVVDEASDGAQAIARGRLEHLDVVVMDLSMPGMSGLVATRKLKELRPDLGDREPDPARGQDLSARAAPCGRVRLCAEAKPARRVVSRHPSSGQRPSIHRSGPDSPPRRAVCRTGTTAAGEALQR